MAQPQERSQQRLQRCGRAPRFRGFRSLATPLPPAPRRIGALTHPHRSASTPDGARSASMGHAGAPTARVPLIPVQSAGGWVALPLDAPSDDPLCVARRSMQPCTRRRAGGWRGRCPARRRPKRRSLALLRLTRAGAPRAATRSSSAAAWRQATACARCGPTSSGTRRAPAPLRAVAAFPPPRGTASRPAPARPAPYRPASPR